MPLGQLVKHVVMDGQSTEYTQPCVLLQEKTLWTVLDPENNNELIKNVSTDFLRKEIEHGRLRVDNGWDLGCAPTQSSR